MHDGPRRGRVEDTAPEVLRVQYAALRRLTPRQRLALADDLTRLARTMTREGLRRRLPACSEAELDERFADLVLGHELAARVRARRRDRGPVGAP